MHPVFLPCEFHLIPAFLCLLSAGAVTLGDLLPQLLRVHRTAIAARHGGLLRATGLDTAADASQDSLLLPVLAHDLLTTGNAVDGNVGGILRSTYFWHWVSPNPRHDLLLAADGRKLASIPPPPGTGPYRSFADVDRKPGLFLSDLVTDVPRYHHPTFGDIRTFGWCSEREEAYGAWVGVLGAVQRIRFSGNHVWSEVLVPSRRRGDRGRAVLVVDNTFDEIRLEPVPPDQRAWERDVGSLPAVRGYNAVARSPRVRSQVRDIPLSDASANRIDSLVRRWYE